MAGTAGSERSRPGLEHAATQAERPEAFGRLEISFLSLPPSLDHDTARLGVDRLVLYPPALDDPEQIETFLRHHAPQSSGWPAPDHPGTRIRAIPQHLGWGRHTVQRYARAATWQELAAGRRQAGVAQRADLP